MLLNAKGVRQSVLRPCGAMPPMDAGRRLCALCSLLAFDLKRAGFQRAQADLANARWRHVPCAHLQQPRAPLCAQSHGLPLLLLAVACAVKCVPCCHGARCRTTTAHTRPAPTGPRGFSWHPRCHCNCARVPKGLPRDFPIGPGASPLPEGGVWRCGLFFRSACKAKNRFFTRSSEIVTTF